MWDNYTIFWKYIKYVFPPFIEVVGLTKFIVRPIIFVKEGSTRLIYSRQYIIIFRVKEAKGKYVVGSKSK